MLNRNWILCSKVVVHFRHHSQLYYWGNLYDQLITHRMFTLTMNKIFIQASKIMREVGTRFSNDLALIASGFISIGTKRKAFI